MKKFLYRGLSAFICLYLGLCSSIGSYASTSSGNETDNGWTKEQKSEFINCEVFKTVLDCFTFILPGGASYDDIQEDWRTLNATQAIENNMSYDDYLLQKCNLSISSSGEVENITIDPQLLNNAQTVVNNYISENPLSYTMCYLYSYNYIDTSVFNNIAPYNSLKEFIKKADGYVLVNCGNYIPANSERGYRIYVVPKSLNIGLYGTVTSGVFTNVQMSINWLSSQNLYNMTDQIKTYYMDPYGNIREGGTGFSDGLCLGILNNNSLAYNSNNKFTMFSNMSKNEPIYVYSTLNAYKQYNSGSPQPYYLGSGFNADKIWYSPQTITGGEVANHQNTYDYVINNVQNGWTAEQVMALVDKVMTKSGSSGSSSSDKDNSKWWERIGNALGNLIDGLVDVITKVIEKLSDALLSIVHLLTGYTDDNGVYHEGLFDKLTDLVDSGFSSFISSMFSWLPDEIVTLLTATLVFGIFFGIFKMLRR